MSESKEKIIGDIKSVAKKLNVNKLSRSEYLTHGKYSSYQLYDDGNSWTDLCKQAGLKTKEKEIVTDKKYFERLRNAYNKLGRYPKVSERKKYGLNMSKRRYATLTEFIKEAVKQGYVPNHFEDEKSQKQIEDENTVISLISSTVINKSRDVPPIPFNTSRKKWERINFIGFPYAPQEEQGVLAIFAILCAKGVLSWQILDISTNGIDCTCYDENESLEIMVELKYILSKSSWNHNIDDLDYLVCWESRWPEFPKPVIELSKLLKV
ncbi:MAG: hypothetical protein U9O95_09450 [Candidatus Marinimicrobia bacterium]|nr:hypothetical protein [Candidatus Neomarinimicrobiota bacterium]